MIRALWFIVQLTVLAGVAAWIANQPGSVHIVAGAYQIDTKLGYALIALLLAAIVLLFLYRIVAAFLRTPRAWARYQRLQRHRRGYRALTLGLTAVAAGDAKQAGYQAQRARRFWPEDRALSTLLEAQAARLGKDDARANAHFEQLMTRGDTAFLGLRGLLLGAMERDDFQEAARLAEQALRLHPDQPWVLRTLYDLDIRLGRWEAAQRHLKRSAALGVLPEHTVRAERAALLLQEGEQLQARGDAAAALGRYKAAHRLHPGFVPAALALARGYLAKDNAKGAAEVIEETWREAPHPDLAVLWRQAMPSKLARDGAGRMSWFEKLVAFRPDSAESQLAAAEMALENNLWGAARAYLERADQIRPGRRIFRLRARLAQALDRTEEANIMLRKAGEAPAEKAWIDRVTGRVYDRWIPVAQPHGGFNTIAWDYPADDRLPGTGERGALLVTPPAPRSASTSLFNGPSGTGAAIV